MAIIDKSGSINNLSSVDTPNFNVGRNLTGGGKLGFVRDTVLLEVGDSGFSKYRFARIPANAVLKEITIAHEAIPTNFNLGFVDVPEVTNFPKLTAAEVLIKDQSFSVADRNKDGMSNVNIADLHKQVSELALFFLIGFNEERLIDIFLEPRTTITTGGRVTITTVFSLE